MCHFIVCVCACVCYSRACLATRRQGSAPQPPVRHPSAQALGCLATSRHSPWGLEPIHPPLVLAGLLCQQSKKKSSKLFVLASAKFLLNLESWFLLCSLLSLKVLVPALQEGVCLGTNQRLEDLVLDWELPLEQVLRVRNKMLLDSLLSDANSVI